jgi:beta-phosphoglucomutase-like phosphatase (HAD superfamily)
MLKGLFFDFDGTLVYSEHVKKLVPITFSVLRWGVKSNLLLALVTNSSRQCVEHMLPQLGLEKTFHSWVLGVDLTFTKPHPLPYLTALDELGLKANEVVVFEDTTSGITSAVDAGIRTICIGSRASEVGQIARFMPEDDPAQLITLLSSL